MNFVYQHYQVESSPTMPDGMLSRPEVPVGLLGQTGHASFLALADTGSDETLLPRSIGEAVGAVIDDSHQWTVAGFGGQELAVVPGQVEFELGTGDDAVRWKAQIGFVNFSDPETEVAILGQAGFFDHFVARFDLRHGELTITPVD